MDNIVFRKSDCFRENGIEWIMGYLGDYELFSMARLESEHAQGRQERTWSQHMRISATLGLLFDPSWCLVLVPPRLCALGSSERAFRYSIVFSDRRVP